MPSLINNQYLSWVPFIAQGDSIKTLPLKNKYAPIFWEVGQMS